MAIKGKGKARSRRMVAAPPRPQLVARRKPLWEMWVTWVVVAAVVLAGIGYAVARSVHNRHVRELQTAEVASVQAFARRISGFMPQDTTNLPGGGGLQIFSSVSPELTSIQQGKVSAKSVSTYAASVQKAATKAANGLTNLNVIQLVPARYTVGETAQMQTPGLTQLTLLQATQEMAQGFGVFQQVATLMQSAAALPNGQRKVVVASLLSLTSQGQQLFQMGYAKLQQMLSVLGVAPPATLTPPSTGVQPPIASPSPTASPAPTASSSP